MQRELYGLCSTACCRVLILADFHWQNTRIRWKCLRGVDALISGVICKGYMRVCWFGCIPSMGHPDLGLQLYALPWLETYLSLPQVTLSAQRSCSDTFWLCSDLSTWCSVSLLGCHREEFCGCKVTLLILLPFCEHLIAVAHAVSS